MELKDKHCTPCEGSTPPLTDNQEDKLARGVAGWEVRRAGIHKVARTFTFKDFVSAAEFVNAVARVAEEEQHHPEIYLSYGKVHIEIYTHKILGLSENDFILAARIDALEGWGSVP